MFAVESRQAFEALQKCGMAIQFIMVSPGNRGSYKTRLLAHGCDGNQVEGEFRDLRSLHRNHQESFRLHVVNRDLQDCYLQVKKLVKEVQEDPFLVKEGGGFFGRSRKRRISWKIISCEFFYEPGNFCCFWVLTKNKYYLIEFYFAYLIVCNLLII